MSPPWKMTMEAS
jgi:hypothetical protein